MKYHLNKTQEPARDRRVRRGAAMVAMAILPVFQSHMAGAATEQWGNASAGNWSNAADWTGRVPLAGDSALISHAGSVVTFDGAYTNTSSLNSLQVGAISGQAPTLSQSTNAMVAMGETIGSVSAGAGNYLESGGSNTVLNTGLSIANGQYALQGTGMLTTNTENISGPDNGTSQGSTYGFGAAFNQFGGNQIISGGLIVALASPGLFNLSGGTLSDGGAAIGDYSFGYFNQLGGGHTIVAGGTGLSLGLNNGGEGEYDLNAGSLTVNGNEVVGSGGSAVGLFVQYQGTDSVTGNLDIGLVNKSVGTFNLQNGSLTAANLYLGGDPSQNQASSGAVGVFNLQAGNVTIGGTTTVYSASGNGINMVGGSITTGSLSFPAGRLNWSGGTINVTGAGGGTNSIPALTVAGANTPTFNFSGGVINTTGVTVGGAGGNGVAVQSVGTTLNCQSLNLGNYNDPNATYNLSGGTLNVFVTGGQSYFYGEFITGKFIQTGGTHTIGLINSLQPLELGFGGGTSGSYTLSGSSSVLTVNGDETIASQGFYSTGGTSNATFNQSGGTNTVNQDLCIGVQNGSNGLFSLSGTGILNIAGSAYVGGGGLFTDPPVPVAGGAGVLNISGGSATVANNLVIYNTSGTAVNFTGGSLTAGTFNTSGYPNLFNWTGGSLGITGSGGFTIASNGPIGSTVTLGAGKALVVTNTVTNNGTINLNGGNLSAGVLAGTGPNWTTGTLSITGSAGLTVGQNQPLGSPGLLAGQNLVVTNELYIVSGGISLQGGSLTYGSCNLAGIPLGGWTSGVLTVTGSAGLTNPASTTVNLVSGQTLNVLNTLTNSGSFNLNGGSLYYGALSGNAINWISGTLSEPVVLSNLTVGSNQILGTLGSTVTVNPNGTLALTAGGVINANLTNSGTVTSTIGFAVPAGGSFQQSGTSSSTHVTGNFTVGANATTGTALVTAGSFYADTVSLGSTGGSGAFTASGTAIVTIGGGLALNDFTVNGGSVTVLNQDPPAGEDPELNRSIVGGYQHSGALLVNGGTVSTPNIKLGITSGTTGTFNQTTGTVMVTGTLGVGNDATETGGSGTGVVNIMGGTLYAGTVLLGDSNGGSGSMTVSGSGSVTVGGGLNMNDFTSNGGTTTVLNQAAPAGEDPELAQSMVGGYLHNGGGYVNSGTVSTPNLKLGITGGCTGTYNQTGGVMIISNIMAVGDDASLTSGAGVGAVNISGGITTAGTLLAGSSNGGTGSVSVSGTGVLNVSSGMTVLAGSSLSVGNGGTLNLLPHVGNTSASVINSFSLSMTGKLDLSNNALDIPSRVNTTLRTLIIEAYANGQWTGQGLTSSTAAADTTHLTTIGILQNNQLGTPIYTASHPFDGVTPGPSDVLVKYTYYGDANLDGKVDGSDYSDIDSGYVTGATGWVNGDFNYDGVVNGSDYTLIDNAFNTQGTALAAVIADPAVSIAAEVGGSSVPEPGAVGLLVIMGMGVLGRRRRGVDGRRAQLHGF